MIAMLFAASGTIPEADPLPLPAPPWLLWFLLLLTFVLHVVVMNFVLGGSVIAAVARFRGDDHAKRLADFLARWMPTAVAAAITFGVAPLLFLQTLYGRLFFSSAVLIAWLWLGIVPVLMAAYYGTYWMAFRGGEARARTVAIVAAVVAVLFTAISFVQSTNMTLMLRPDLFLPKYLSDARGLHLNAGDPTFLPRWLHMILGAVALGGLAVSLYGLSRRAEDEEHARWAMRWGALWFVVPTAANLLTGLWWLGVLPREVILRFMGRDVPASLSLGIGVVLGFVTLGMMLMAVATAEPSKLVKRSAWTMAGTLVAMILARDGVRRGMLAEAGFTPSVWVEPQWGVIAIFAVLLVGALAATGWMAWILARSPARGA